MLAGFFFSFHIVFFPTKIHPYMPFLLFLFVAPHFIHVNFYDLNRDKKHFFSKSLLSFFYFFMFGGWWGGWGILERQGPQWKVERYPIYKIDAFI